MSISTKKALVIGHNWPEPNTTAAGRHMIQLLVALQNFGYEVTFASTASKTAYSQNLGHMGVKEVVVRLNHHSFNEFVVQIAPKVVVFDRFMTEEKFGWRVAESAPKALRILNTEDLHSLRNTRENCHKVRTVFSIEKWLQSDMTKREIASIYRSDLTLLVSTLEIKLLQGEVRVPAELLLHLPFMLDELTATAITKLPSFEERSGFICLGNGKHGPNVDSVNYLKREIWPLIRKQLPKAEVHVFGAYLPQETLKLNDPKEGFLIRGWVEDLELELQRARVNLAPLRFGAGIKGKLIDAMRNGTPSVSTSIGVEGMHDGLPWAGNIAENAADFVQKTVFLYQNRQDWIKKQQNGVEIINQLYSKKKLSKQFERALKNLQSNLTAHRNKNFIGSMLQHQTLAATKYMGKWIEEKNREDSK